MKKITTLFLLLILIKNVNAQININIQGGFSSIQGGTQVDAFACQGNSFNLQLTAATYFLVQPDSTIYLRINDATSIEFPNLVTLPNSNAAGAKFYPLFLNTGSVIDTFRLDSFLVTTPMFVNCSIIGNLSAPSAIQQFLGLYNNGNNLTTSITGNFNGSSIVANQISYNVYFPFIENSNQQSTLDVNYITHRLPNNRFERIVTYKNTGGLDTNAMEMQFNFTDLLDCPSFEFDSIQYFINGSTPVNIPSTVIDSFVTTVSPTIITIRKGDYLYIREVITLKDNCFLNDCSDQNRTFNANFNWGCADLCKNLLQQTLIRRGSLRPHLTINRVEPANTATINNTNGDFFWDTLFSTQSITNFRFRIANRDSDVVNDVKFDAADFILSNMYFVTDSNNIVIIPSFTGSRNFSRLSIPYDSVEKKPSCVKFTYPNSIRSFHFSLDYLLPNDSIDIIIPVVYCCPDLDNGSDTTVVDLFEESKALNTWGVTTTGKSGCNCQLPYNSAT